MHGSHTHCIISRTHIVSLLEHKCYHCIPHIAHICICRCWHHVVFADSCRAFVFPDACSALIFTDASICSITLYMLAHMSFQRVFVLTDTCIYRIFFEDAWIYIADVCVAQCSYLRAVPHRSSQGPLVRHNMGTALPDAHNTYSVSQHHRPFKISNRCCRQVLALARPK